MRFAKVVIVNPPDPAGYVTNRDSMGGFGQLFAGAETIMPPLDAPYLAGYPAENGVRLEIVEAQGLQLTKLQMARKVADIAERTEDGGVLVVVRGAIRSLSH